MKSCSVCGKTLPLDAFQRKASVSSGRASACRKCDSARRIQAKIDKGLRRPDPAPGLKWCGKCETEKPLDDFYQRISGKQAGKPHAHCKPCVKADNVARARRRGVQPWQAADPLYARRRKLAAYGLTMDDYETLLAQQGGVCLGCGVAANRDGRNFAVDHDHACCPGAGSCGKCVRGLLCVPCNFAIGHAEDDPERLRRLATYLELYASGQLSDS